ncbi:hypothetical protein [Rhizobium sp. FKY42]|uniref:hypothetical protein n=1 Tax=Rhizobium sp. FKY42 TaxID=2562310 RepID=UPI00148565F8|nr:hypothetical protein [Rhizobium sp. FKY42]
MVLKVRSRLVLLLIARLRQGLLLTETGKFIAAVGSFTDNFIPSEPKKNPLNIDNQVV